MQRTQKALNKYFYFNNDDDDDVVYVASNI